MKKIIKIIIGAIIFFTILIFIVGNLLHTIVSDVSEEVDNNKEKYEVHIGEKYVISNDTFIVIDYSMIGETFTLSNGQKVNSELIFNNK